MKSEILDKLKELYSHPVLRNYISNAIKIQGDSKDYLSYFGINYNKGKLLNLKIYFTFFRKLTSDEVHQLIPDSTDFYKDYDKLLFDAEHTLSNTGCTFALKIDVNGNITYYYHYRLPGKAVKLPLKISLTEQEIEANNNTRCMEYSGEEVFPKDYYLLFSASNITKLLDRFKISFFKDHNLLPDVIEYTETSKWDKIIIGIDSPPIQEKFVKYISDKDMLDVIEFLCDKKQLMTASCSVYENSDTKAVYFCEKKDKVFLSNNNTIVTYQHDLFDF
ncbi:MAG: hypothetical protein HY062_16575 [Bacteroidetes bacterium]|nr:hypothetical protein [Bacteroidota bacterium]